jgi:hypothetical protein
MKCLHTTTEDPNQIYALDYRPDGLKFATAGQDYQVPCRTYLCRPKKAEQGPNTAH